jgi:hypothetical protein
MEYWKFKAIDKLRDYPLKAAAIQSLQEELQRLELEATNIRNATADATPVQGGGSTREDKLLSNIIHRDEIKRMIAGAKLACNVVNISVTSNQPQISSSVHCRAQRFSNCFWSISFLGLAIRALLSLSSDNDIWSSEVGVEPPSFRRMRNILPLNYRRILPCY